MADFTKLFKAIEDAVTCQRKAPNMACSICTLNLRTEYELLVGENWEHKEELLCAAAPSLPSDLKTWLINFLEGCSYLTPHSSLDEVRNDAKRLLAALSSDKVSKEETGEQPA